MRRALFTLFLILAAGLDGAGSYAAGGKPDSGSVTVEPLPPLPPLMLSRHRSGELFFEIDDTAPFSNERAARPRRVRLYWDHSLSRLDDNLDAERTLLHLYLDAVHPGIIDVVLFAGAASELKIIEAPGEAAQLADVLRDLPYDGAGPAPGILDQPLPPADSCVYFSDGNSFVDPSEAERLGCPLFVVSSAEDANRGFLRVLARRGAGAHLDLSTKSANEAVALLTGGAPRVLSVTSSDGHEIAYALLPSAAGRFRIIGLVPSSGEIAVTLASGKKRTRTYTTKGVLVQPYDAIGALWASDRLSELAARARPDTQRIVAFAHRYSLEIGFPSN